MEPVTIEPKGPFGSSDRPFVATARAKNDALSLNINDIQCGGATNGLTSLKRLAKKMKKFVGRRGRALAPDGQIQPQKSVTKNSQIPQEILDNQDLNTEIEKLPKN